MGLPGESRASTCSSTGWCASDCPLREPNTNHRAIAGKAGYQDFSELRDFPVSAFRGCILLISHKHAKRLRPSEQAHLPKLRRTTRRSSGIESQWRAFECYLVQVRHGSPEKPKRRYARNRVSRCRKRPVPLLGLVDSALSITAPAGARMEDWSLGSTTRPKFAIYPHR